MTTIIGTAGMLIIGDEYFPMENLSIEIATTSVALAEILEKHRDTRFALTRIEVPMDFQVVSPKETTGQKSYGPARKGRGGKVRRW